MEILAWYPYQRHLCLVNRARIGMGYVLAIAARRTILVAGAGRRGILCRRLGTHLAVALHAASPQTCLGRTAFSDRRDRLYGQQRVPGSRR